MQHHRVDGVGLLQLKQELLHRLDGVVAAQIDHHLLDLSWVQTEFTMTGTIRKILRKIVYLV